MPIDWKALFNVQMSALQQSLNFIVLCNRYYSDEKLLNFDGNKKETDSFVYNQL